MDTIQSFLKHTKIAYFSMEIALRPEIRTYSGGLGILAGDCARSSADLALPLVFVTLVSHEGYLRQEIGSGGEQIDYSDPWRVEDWALPLDSMVAIDIEGRSVWVRPWLYVVSCPLGGRVPVLLLDTRLEQNRQEDQGITDRLYGGDAAYRLKQEMVLGIGGARILEALGFEIRKFHLNEGHASLLTLHLLAKHGSSDMPKKARLNKVREACVFTTHTPVEAGHDRFSYGEVARILGRGGLIELDSLKQLGGEEELNMTLLALNLSRHVNGVAEAHAVTTRRMFPGYQVGAITNGVHVPTWTHPAFAELFQGVLPSWAHQPERLMCCEQLPDEAVWNAHQKAKADLLDAIARETGQVLDEKRPIIAFARRMTGYKRPDLIFADLNQLRAINRRYPFQIVIGGKAHPRDGEGKMLIKKIHHHVEELAMELPVAFVPNYDMALARRFVSGADVWLNSPVPPLEASGTSGMKAALNGVLNLSVLDGWWIEGWVEGVTGWAIGEGDRAATEHASDCLDKLERTVLPLFYGDRPRWIWMMKQSISKIGSYFNSHRMMRRYGSEVYLS